MPCGVPVGQASAVTLVEDMAQDLTAWARDASDSAEAALSSLTNLIVPDATNPSVGYEFSFVTAPEINRPDAVVNNLTGLTVADEDFTLDSAVDVLPSIDDIEVDLTGVEAPGSFTPVNDPFLNLGALDKPGNLTAEKPDAPTNVREFSEEDYPDSPEVTYASGLVIPNPPTLKTLNFPDAPDITLPEAPAFVSPTLSAPIPTAVFDYLYTPYSSDLQSAVSAELLDRIQNGGTGLNNDIEQAIWDRARNREDINANRSELEIINAQDSRGFERPTGSHMAAMDFLAQETQSKIADLSREVAIKQADLEQKNLEYSIQAAVALEGQLLNAHLQEQDLAFRSAETKVKLAYELYNLEIATLNAELEIYKTNFQVFTAQVQAELAEVEIYKTEIEAQAEIGRTNQQAIDIYKTRISAVSEAVNTFRIQVEAVNSQIAGEKLKLEQYGLELSAYTKEIEGYRAEYDTYTAQLAAEKTKADVYRTEADVYASRIAAYSAQVGAATNVASTQVEIEKLDLAAYTSRLALQSTKFDAAKAKVSAVGTAVDAEGRRFSAESQLGIAQATAAAEAARTNATIARNKSDVALSNAQIYSANVNSYRDALLRNSLSLAELTSATQQSAMGAMNVGASMSSSASDSLSQSYRCS